ncbi:beta-ketoacyl-ACP synthase 3 [Actinomadura sp. KC06]|nr:beta-ketoacyl-ACP synthase 3 [Actinomadura sp. KC06]
MGSYLPRRRRLNEEIATTTGGTGDWIAVQTGIRARHTAAADEATSDMAATAVRAAVAASGIDIEQIGLLILGTSTPDELAVATACRVQAMVKAHEAVAFDVSAACSGWLFAARVAHHWMRCERHARYAAVVGVDVFSKFLNPADRATTVLFGDGAAAAILGPVPEGGFLDFYTGSDGRHAHEVLIPAGGSRMPATQETVQDKRHTVYMDGRAVRDFIIDIFPRAVEECLHRNHLTLSDIDAIVSHQPNPVLLRALGAKLGVPEDRLVVAGEEVGNIGAAALPYALATAAAQGRLRAGGRVLAVAFGAGVTWGTTLLTWTGASAVRIGPAPQRQERAHSTKGEER